MSIIVPLSTNNPNLPLDGDISKQITAYATCEGWLQGDVDWTTVNVSNQVSTFTSRNGGDTFTLSGTATKATLIDNQIAGNQIARFAVGSPARYLFNGTLNTSQSFSFVFCVKPVATASSQFICGRQTNSTNRAMIMIAANATTGCQIWYESSIINIPMTMGEFGLAMVCYDGTKLRVHSSGGITETTVANATDTSTFYVGALGGIASPLTSDVSDILLFSEAVDTNAGLFQLVEDYFQNEYGLSF